MIDKPNVNLTLKAKQDSILEAHKVLVVGRYTDDVYLKNPLERDLEDSHAKNMFLKFKELNKDTSVSILGIKPDVDGVDASAKLTLSSEFIANETITINVMEAQTKVNVVAPKTIQQVAQQLKIELEKNKYIRLVDLETTPPVSRTEGTFKATNIVSNLAVGMVVCVDINTSELTLAKKTNDMLIVGIVQSIDAVEKTAVVTYLTNNLANQEVLIDGSYTPTQNDVLTIKGGKAVATGNVDGYVVTGATLDVVTADPSYWRIQISTDITSIDDVLQYAITPDVTEAILTLFPTLLGKLGNGIYFTCSSQNIELEGFSGGVSNDVVDFSIIGDDRYQTIAYSNDFDTDILDAFLISRQNKENQLLEGVGVYGTVNNFSLDSYNNFTLTKLSVKEPINHIDMFTSIFCSARSKRLTDGASISDLVSVTAGTTNSIGGLNLSPIPYHNTSLTKYVSIASDYTRQETNELENLRYSVIGYDLSETNVLVGDVYTTYRVNTDGVQDDTFKYLNNTDVALSSKEYFFNNLKADNRQSTLSTGVARSRFGQKNQAEITSDMVKYWFALVDTYGILQDNQEDFKANLIVNLIPSTGTINLDYLIHPIIGFRAINGTLSIQI